MKIDRIERRAVHQTISHVNLHYRCQEDGPIAARLLELLGLTRSQEMDLPTGGTFYRFTVHSNDVNRADGIIYLSPLPSATAALFEAIGDKLRIGAPDEHPAVAVYRAAQATDPEFNFHVGFLVDSLDAIEERLAELQRLERTDPAFGGRLKILVNRALPGDPVIDARLDASPLYAGVDRYTYGRNGVQAFVETDIIVDGPLAEGLVIELDYVFPGHAAHILSVSEITR